MELKMYIMQGSFVNTFYLSVSYNKMKFFHVQSDDRLSIPQLLQNPRVWWSRMIELHVLIPDFQFEY